MPNLVKIMFAEFLSSLFFPFSKCAEFIQLINRPRLNNLSRNAALDLLHTAVAALCPLGGGADINDYCANDDNNQDGYT